jgi:hypothetical protein
MNNAALCLFHLPTHHQSSFYRLLALLVLHKRFALAKMEDQYYIKESSGGSVFYRTNPGELFFKSWQTSYMPL